MSKRGLAILILTAAALSAANQKKLPKAGGINFFSKEQDVQMGKEYAQQVEQQLTVVANPELTAFIGKIGKRLVEKGQLDPAYPYSFKVVSEPSINAFALPGGPMFVHTGLIKAADNEAQIAGVLAHELSHVVLRHGTNQASKAQLIQIPAMIGGMMAGGSLAGSLAQIGIGLGANSVLLKFSRSAESDADLLGAHIMAKAGYNPIEMARFFEKLEAEMGSSGNSKLLQFLSDHPNPGNRVKAIEDQLPYMARGPFNAQEGELKRMQGIVDKLPAPQKKRPGQGSGSPAPATAPKPMGVPVSSNMKPLQGAGFAIDYPDNWTVNNGQNSTVIAPKEGLVQNAIGYGVIVSVAKSRSGQVNLANDTRALLQQMAQQNPGMKVVEQPQQIVLGGSQALVTKLASESPYANTRETDVVITVDRGNALFYMIFVAPEPDYQQLEQVYQQMARSVRFQ
ncbi:MAG: M48 family metalloprotease [Acidobacteria bacterium]|nr:M48 family metalloprotease [Acidobacteriota bacterium]